MNILRSYLAFTEEHKTTFAEAQSNTSLSKGMRSKPQCKPPPQVTILDDVNFKHLIEHNNCNPGTEVTILTHPEFIYKLNRYFGAF